MTARIDEAKCSGFRVGFGPDTAEILKAEGLWDNEVCEVWNVQGTT